MLKFQAQVYRINDLSGWNDRRELTLAPDFQRRRVWSPRGKSFLIDSILRGMPLPQFFIREIVHPRERRTIREVVDGQQRMSTILGFLSGEFMVLPMHNADYGRMKFDELPDNVQKEFLSFPLSVNILQGAEDSDVLEIFSRLNSYSVPLNQQEKLNARYVGSFKRAVTDVAKDHLAFWKRHQILTAQPIARMRDLELTSELIAAMLYGLQNQKKIVPVLYKQFDDAFPPFGFIQQRFSETLQRCEDFLSGRISATAFRRTSLFYSLYCAIYDSSYGFQSNDNVRPRRVRAEAVPQVQESLLKLSESLEAEEINDDLEDFYRSTRQSTDKLPQRQTRHAMLKRLLEPAFPN